jgi:hypothetical protein
MRREVAYLAALPHIPVPERNMEPHMLEMAI